MLISWKTLSINPCTRILDGHSSHDENLILVPENSTIFNQITEGAQITVYPVQYGSSITPNHLIVHTVIKILLLI